ncbi:MAG: hypothetical protein NC177_17575 [Ruminococcus flavefaciens]|nr:hypothetical protein [Ruminococcus flavefaciens]
MEYSKLMQKIENGKQVGIRKITEHDGIEFAYTYALQKIKGFYVAYTQKLCLDEMYCHEGEFNSLNESFEIYESLPEVLEIFRNKYNVLLEDLNTSRGNKFFWDENINLVRYTGETSFLTLTHNKIYNVYSIEKKWYRIVDDSGEDYLYPPELFDRVYGDIIFKSLDMILSYNDTMDYWYDEGFCYAQKLLADFSDDDWKALSAIILSRSSDYQKKLVYCFDGSDEFHELKIIEKLLSVDDDELFIICVDSLRNFSTDELNKHLLDKIKAKADVSGRLSGIVIEEFFKEI